MPASSAEPVAARRILVYGVTGSGKTTMAERISRATSIPWHSVDDLTWRPGWTEVPHDEQRRRIEAICAGEAWILDTAYARWLDVPLARAEVIVALDYPRWFSLQRLVRRTVTRALDRRPICNGNRESLRTVFSKNSIVSVALSVVQEEAPPRCVMGATGGWAGGTAVHPLPAGRGLAGRTGVGARLASSRRSEPVRVREQAELGVELAQARARARALSPAG